MSVVAELLVLVLASALAGAVNAVAGGGTVITFPTLLWLGVDPVVANATNSVALWPGGVAGAWGFRRQLAEMPRVFQLLVVPSLVGGAAGAVVLVRTPPQLFEALAPWLVLAATVLIAAQDRARARLAEAGGHQSARWWVAAVTAQLAIAVYGGYFGGGMGILMLAALALLGFGDIHQMNGLKNLLGAAIKGAAVVSFALTGTVRWWLAVLMAVSAAVGALAGAYLALRVGRQRVRWAVVAIGITMAGSLLARLWL